MFSIFGVPIMPAPTNRLMVLDENSLPLKSEEKPYLLPNGELIWIDVYGVLAGARLKPETRAKIFGYIDNKYKTRNRLSKSKY